jgi:Integrase core domain
MIKSSPSFVRGPEGNGIAERFFRTLKEQLFWVQTFQDVNQLFIALQDFRRRYNVPGSSPATATSRPASAAANSSLWACLRPKTHFSTRKPLCPNNRHRYKLIQLDARHQLMEIIAQALASYRRALPS